MGNNKKRERMSKCARCGKTAYAAEQQRYDEKIYHALCLSAHKKELSVNKNPEYPQNRPQGARVDVGISASDPTKTVFGSGLGSRQGSSSGGGGGGGGGAKFCSGCGNARADMSANFCPSCGKKY